MTPRQLSALLLPLVALAAPDPARACGAMVFPSHAERVSGMSDQELLIAFADTETVLVASAGYEGVNADEFAFVLPLASEPGEVRDADPALLIALDELSAPRVEIFVDTGESFGGCASDGGGKGFGDGDVMVHQRGATATYEWVVIGGDTGTAIAAWLSDAGYALPPDYAAAFDAYAADDWFFFAARVRPEIQSAALSPIELHLPPAQPETFEIPLAIAAHSLAPDRPLRTTTYVWAGGPVLPAAYDARAVDDRALVARSDSETNYAELERAVLDEGAWLIDVSADFSVDDLQAAYAAGVDAGRVDFTEGADLAIADFFARIDQSTGHLTRLRAELGPEQLRDTALLRDTGATVGNVHQVTLDERPAGTCEVDRRGGLVNLLLLAPILAWIRRRPGVSARRS